MRSWILMGVLAVPVVSHAADSHPDLSTVHGLYQLCLDKDLSLACGGYIAGVADSMHWSTAVLENEHDIHLNTDWCAPASTTKEQGVQAFKNWHNAHPEAWQMSSVAGVMAALQATWPCKKK
jgi:hypothetical protein